MACLLEKEPFPYRAGYNKNVADWKFFSAKYSTLLHFFWVRSCKQLYLDSAKAVKVPRRLLTKTANCWRNGNSSCFTTDLELLRLPSSERFLVEPLLLDNQDFTPSTRSSTSESVSESPWLVRSQTRRGSQQSRRDKERSHQIYRPIEKKRANR